MSASDLIEELKKFPPTMDVVHVEIEDGSAYFKLNEIHVCERVELNTGEKLVVVHGGFIKVSLEINEFRVNP